jgi:hypothetical protein
MFDLLFERVSNVSMRHEVKHLVALVVTNTDASKVMMMHGISRPSFDELSVPNNTAEPTHYYCDFFDDCY